MNDHVVKTKPIGVCKISGLPVYEIWDNYFGYEEPFCHGKHKGKCEWERVNKEEFIKALKKEKEVLKGR